MASLYNRNGRWTLQFLDASGERRTVGLGALTLAGARTIAGHVEYLTAAMIANTAPPQTTLRWLADQTDALHGKLAAAGLIEPRASATLEAFANAYRDTRTHWSEAARTQFGLATKDAVHHFGADRDLRSITRADVDAFAAWLISPNRKGDGDEDKRLSTATARKRMRLFKMLCRHAVRAGILNENPAEDQRTANARNESRQHYIDRDTALAVAAELDGDVRLIFLLARFAGLRVPSEPYALAWADVNWDTGVLRVYAPKTDRARMVPILPDVMSALLAAHECAAAGETRVIAHRRPLPVLRRNVERAIVRAAKGIAGLTAWVKLFQNLRASFATDCVRLLPAHTAAALLGHSPLVAAESYWIRTADDVQSAALALQSGATSKETEQNGAPDASDGLQENTGNPADLALAGSSLMGGEGLEPPTLSV